MASRTPRPPRTTLSKKPGHNPLEQLATIALEWGEGDPAEYLGVEGDAPRDARELEELLENAARSLQERREIAFVHGGRLMVTRLRAETPKSVLELAEQLVVSARTHLPSRELMHQLSNQIAQSVDRAARGPESWAFSPFDYPRFVDGTNLHAIEYVSDRDPIDALQETVAALGPRTADVWRLITARTLEVASEGMDVPAVWLDVKELLSAMGYKKATNGGYRPEQLQQVVQALRDLDSFWITVSHGTGVIEHRGGRREKVEAQRRYKVIATEAIDEMRNLFGDRQPLRWKIKPGSWINDYPREFAPLFRRLVEMSAGTATEIWAKALGTELTYNYRSSSRMVMKVQTLLERAGLMVKVDDWRASSNAWRAREYFDRAMDELQRLGVCERWEYDPQDAEAVERASKANKLGAWLRARVSVTSPPWVARDQHFSSLPPV